MSEFTFCLQMPEENHYVIENTLYNKCRDYKCRLEAYQRITDTIREVKIRGPHQSIESVKKYMVSEKITDHIVKKPS